MAGTEAGPTIRSGCYYLTDGLCRAGLRTCPVCLATVPVHTGRHGGRPYVYNRARGLRRAGLCPRPFMRTDYGIHLCQECS